MLDAKVHKGCVQSYDAVANTIALCDCGGDGPCNWKDGKRVKPVQEHNPQYCSSNPEVRRLVAK